MTTEQGAGSALASAASLVRPRSATCGPECRKRPCTLREIRYAERELDQEPVLIVWAELSVLSHLLGQPMPVPATWLLDALHRFGSRHRECTFSHAVDAAARARIPAFARQLSAKALAAHVNDAMKGLVSYNGTDCGPEEVGTWSVPRSERDLRALVFGADRPSRLETAVGCSHGEPGWPERMVAAVEDLRGCAWVTEQLAGRW
ncbi:hypothetical protein [Microlunatus sp. GCM10028923]|uniref:hypothetical protein n=1 Tax=Microlunatus sp. GCM10028923 TaxID=3273400 RepID=UPI00361EB967